ncbi:hypothetical protein [Geodermatophilus sp. SYSU D00710]
MSSYLYGTLSRRRLTTSAGEALVYAQADQGAAGGRAPRDSGAKSKEVVSHWQDVLVALVPAEVLAFHGVAMTVGTTTTGSGDDTTTVITAPHEMVVVYWILVALAFLLYLGGSKSLKPQDLARAAVASIAFVLWTLIQPSTAFDAFDWNPSTLIRLTIALAGAAILSFIVNGLATKADKTQG